MEAAQKQVHTFYIQGADKIIPDSLSRLTSSGDYYLKDKVFHEDLTQLKVMPTIDMFANGKNRKFKKFVSVVRDSWEDAQDCLSVPWLTETLYQYSPISLIQATLQNIEPERVKALLIVPYWPAKPWLPNHVRVTSKYMILGKCNHIGRIQRS
ncbi:MAG: hypothetical protein EZS28_017060 [Streblomastix strix]|uniref:Uncharacterized protein n=1 Tax=Streblomastix strix TaxID=222440 RepID=A0A5J4VY12_9EUKA|nr:MAG: hypothetical protein EZS28_017060 [Streblomastix strix]